MNHSSPVTLQEAAHRDFAGDRATDYQQEERPIRPSREHCVAPSGDITFKKECSGVTLFMATTAKTRSVTAHVPEQLAQKVDLMAERLDRSKNWIVKQALSAWIDQEEERSRLTREALADVDAGCVIDHQAVQAWADSLSTDAPLPVPR